MDPATFRAVYPQFGDLIAYPPEAIAYWQTVAVSRLDGQRWADRLDEGLMLFVAHKLTLADLSARGANGGGVVSSKSVGGVSVAYNTEMGSVENAGAYNMTPFGREFLSLARLVGMGGMQV